MALHPPLPRLGIGTSPLSGMPDIYGHDVDADAAAATLDAVLDSSIRFIDTSNQYGDGRGEERVGAALRRAGERAARTLVVTKSDPLPGGRFDAERVRASFAESTRRLSRPRFPLFHLHDPERVPFEDLVGPRGAVEGMIALRDAGLVDRIGVAGGDLNYIRRLLDLELFDVVLNHNRFTLLDRGAESLIAELQARDIPFMNAAPFASGILAKQPAPNVRYQYGTPSSLILRQVSELRLVSAHFEVPLAALALQFSTRDPRVASTIVGVSSPERVRELVRLDSLVIPAELWRAAGSIVGIETPLTKGTEQRLS